MGQIAHQVEEPNTLGTVDMKLILRTLLVTASALLACARQESMPVERYYDYDRSFPLELQQTVLDSSDVVRYHIKFRSVHEAVVTGIFSRPSGGKNFPTIIFLHGIEDHKDFDYMQAGEHYFLDAGYAVLRIDIANHGERKIHDYDYDFTSGYRYWTRDIVAQTVFDLRRAVDFLETRPEIDSTRIGFMGISFGGMIGTVFCGVEQRIKVPVIALAGGQLNLAFKFKALAQETAIYLSIMDPINFVDRISPRPLLMLNAKKDEIVPPVMTKALFRAAGEPKDIIWYPTKHRQVPLDEAFPAAVEWFDHHLQ